MLINELLSKDPDIVPEEAYLIKLDIKSAICVAKNGKYVKHTRNISKRVHFVIMVKNVKLQKIDWCEGDLKLADIATMNVGEKDLNPRIKYIMLTLEN